MNHAYIRSELNGWMLCVCVCVCVCSDCSIGRSLSLSLPLSGPFCSLRHNSIEIRPINNPTMTSKCSSDRESHMSLTFSQKIEVVKFSEEGILKAKIGQKLGLLH